MISFFVLRDGRNTSTPSRILAYFYLNPHFMWDTNVLSIELGRTFHNKPRLRGLPKLALGRNYEFLWATPKQSLSVPPDLGFDIFLCRF